MKKQTTIILIVSVILIGLGVIGFFWNQEATRASRTSQMMEVLIEELASAISRERDFFEANTSMENYPEFVQSLDKDFDTLELEFSNIHRQVMEDMNKEHEKRVKLFIELLDYHYMLLKSQVALSEFETAVNELTGFIEAGQVTTNTYNHQLEAIMAKYGDLMNYSSLMDSSNAMERSDEEYAQIVQRLGEVQVELKQMEGLSETDQYAHSRILRMFGALEQSVGAVEAYPHKQALQQITENGTEAYVKSLLE